MKTKAKYMFAGKEHVAVRDYRDAICYGELNKEKTAWKDFEWMSPSKAKTIQDDGGIKNGKLWEK